MKRLELAERIIELRERAGLTQGEAAKRAGVGVTTWSNLETGTITRPHARTLIKIARALGVEPEELASPKVAGPARQPNAEGQAGPVGKDRRGETPEEAGRRGAREAIEELAASGPLYTVYEGQGRILASNLQEELEEWENKIPAGKIPDLFEAGRFLQWILDLARDKSIYEAMIRDTNFTQRPEMKDTLKLLEDAQKAAERMLRRVIEPIKDGAEFRKIWEANNMDAILNNAELDV